MDDICTLSEFLDTEEGGFYHLKFVDDANSLSNFLKDVSNVEDKYTLWYRDLKGTLYRRNGYWVGETSCRNRLRVRQWKMLEAVSHCGLSGNIGFDCDHYSDWTPRHPWGVFRSYSFAKNVMIDLLRCLSVIDLENGLGFWR